MQKILMEMARKNFERGKVDNEHLLLMNRFLMNVNNKLQSLPT